MTDFAKLRSEIFVSLLSDVLDGLGYRRQALPPAIRPLDDASVMVGRARTALYMDVYEVTPDENPYELEIALIDSLQPDEIPVFSCGGTGRIAPWGELLTTAARVRGASGVLMDGLVRDVKAIRRMGFPVFHAGIGPLDSKGRGKVAQIDVPIECAGVSVTSGDLVVGDADGVIVVPQAVEDQTLEGAFAKLQGERNTLADLQAGAKLADVFAKYGIL
ncbi:MAG TPA: RraA family protein [Acetobacteraceae bacterium]|nr:RraA family protein [Acetobacteraceae bacterium]